MREIIYTLPSDLRAVVQEELQSTEKVIWAEQPIPKHFAREGMTFLWFGFFFTGFAICWMIGYGLQENVFPFIGLLFVAIGIGMLIVPFWMRKNAKSSVYFITEKRAILFEKRFGIKVRSFYPNQIQHISREQFKDGSGHIILKHDYFLDSDNFEQKKEIGFRGVNAVKKVEDLLRKLAEPGASC